MAKLFDDGEYVIVERGDTLWQIASDYGNGKTWQHLAASNKIKNPDYITVGQKIKVKSGSSSGSSGSASSTAANSNKPAILQFGLLSTSDNTLYATWEWTKSNTGEFKVLWTYNTGNGIWFEGSNTTIKVDEDAPELSRQCTYSIPANAKQVRFKVKPISKYKNEKKKTTYWTADWSDLQTYTDGTPLATPGSAPTVEIDKYKLTATLTGIVIEGATHIEFQVVKNNETTAYATKKAEIITEDASHAFTVDAGAKYKVRCRAYNNNDDTYSDWTRYSAEYGSIPSTPASAPRLEGKSKTSIYVEWDAVPSADKYDIEYATKKTYFDGTDMVQMKSGIEDTHFTFEGLETGLEYFFRVRAVNSDISEGHSGWSEISSVTIGKKPAAPTTWSSSTTVIRGEALTLYWVHNAVDGSSQTKAELEIYINGVFKETHTIKNSTDEDEKDKTSLFRVDTNEYVEGTKLEWRVRTAGIVNEYGDWSVQRSIDIYAPATLVLSMIDSDGRAIDTLTAFPFYIKGIPGPKETQFPISYHLSITANEAYEAIDEMGNAKYVNAGEQLYSRYADISTDLMVELSANNLNLENNIKYTVTCTVSMNSGLTATESLEFTVTWTDERYTPNAEISIDEESLTAYIRPYCEEYMFSYHRVDLIQGVYVVTDETIGGVYGNSVPGAFTTSGEKVYSGITEEGASVYYCEVEERTPVNDILMSVYRREFDGSFTELATGLDSSKHTTITDPHPSLDYARYRIVATSKITGAVSYYDVPGVPIEGAGVVIQWNETWSRFDTSETAELVQPPWSGSLLKLLYNIDVSDDSEPDVELAKYIGREHPVSYYGTQIGHKANWNMVIDKNDKDTLYALRRLQRWMGDVYVREPSGSGYWANITVSFSQNHKDVTIPVTLAVTRVEGGA